MAFNIFERWPWTSFQNLNLDWLLKAMKQAVTKAEEASQTAEDAAGTVAGFDERITQATTTANLAKQESFAAQTTATNAQSAAAAAQDTADLANLRAATAQSTATNALDDYLNVEITLRTSSPAATANKNVDDILSAYSNGKKIRFLLSDVRNTANLISYDFKIIPTIGSTDTHIMVVFEDNLSSTAYNAIVADFAKISGSHSLSVMDVTFAGSGGSAANAVLYVAQTLTSAQMAQARQNIGAGMSTVSYDPSTGELTINTGGAISVYQINQPGIPEITNTETTIQTTIDPNKFYVFPNAGQLTIDFNPGTSGVVNEYHFRFTSGSTATQLDLPATVEIPDDFDVAANTVYEVSIIDNYMVYSSWAVTA